MSNRGFIDIIMVVGVVILVGVAGYFAVNRQMTPSPAPTPVACTKEAKQCPDGSYVGRTGPNCEFTACPEANLPSTPNSPISLLRICPEEWYDNRMPSTVGTNDLPREYFIYKGVRRELSEFDINWVKANCSVTPQIVY